MTNPPGSDAAHAPAPPHIPDYELLRRVGSGAYGEVWLARGLTGAWRAIKIVGRERFADAEPFEREFRGLTEFTAISLAEPGQLALLHVGRDARAGFFYYVMELADDAAGNRDIDSARYVPLTLRELRTRRGRLPVPECVTIAVAVTRALGALHARGLVHRDIKPSNIVLVGGVPKLADIGLVASAADARTFVGTEGYVPPEGPGTPAADVFALGKVLYELATGLDRTEFPRLPEELEQLPDRAALLELNEVLLRACDPAIEERHRDAAALLADLTALQAGRSLRRRRLGAQLRRAGLAAVVVGGALAAGVWTWRGRDAPAAALTVAAASSPAAAQEKAIAVLPFVNLSDDGANAFFADGVHEDILTNLSSIRDLRVLSRTSVAQYRDTRKSSRQIGEELGVAFLLEGSVRRAGGKVRVSAQLIHAPTDRHLWAMNYDRDLTDIFMIQTELAKAIAAELKTAISPAEERAMGFRATENPAAYDLFLRAKAVSERGGAEVRLADLQTGVELLTRAIQIDPKFARAWADLASIHGSFYSWNFDRSEARRLQALAAIETAMMQAPMLREVRGGLGYYHYNMRDWPRAREQFQWLADRYPNDATPLRALAYIERRLGRFAVALPLFQRAVALDPSDIESVHNLARHLFWGRRFTEAEPVFRRLGELRPEEIDHGDLPAGLATLAFDQRGSIAEGEAFFAALPPAAAQTAAMLVRRRDWAEIKGDAVEFLRLHAQLPASEAPSGLRSPPAINSALALARTGDLAAARARATPLLADLRATLEREPDNASLWLARAAAEALLGEREAAIRHARHAATLVPPDIDALSAGFLRTRRAGVFAWAGDSAAALAELEALVKAAPSVSVHRLRRSWWYAPLHGDPRFEALLNDPQSNAPLF